MTATTTTTPPKIRREDLKPGEVLCAYCTGKCCRYFALPMDTPENWDDYDHIRWFMAHGRISVFVEDDSWYLMVHADCRYLLPDNRCNIYDDRPVVCRKYSTDNCEYDEDARYDKFFETPEQVWEYAEAILPPRKVKRSKQGMSLPILSSAG